MTAPLVSKEVDLRDFAFMPLDVLRLRDSELAADTTGDEFKAAVILWCASWHQVPAGSLPSNEAAIARLAGHVLTSKKWRSIRDGALRGWVQCDDNRFYHPVVSEKANEAWILKVRQRERTDAARKAKLAAKSTNESSVTDNVTAPVTCPVTTSVGGNPTHPVTTSKGPDRTGPDLKKENDHPSPPTIYQGEGDLKGFAEFWELFPKGDLVSRHKSEAEWMTMTLAERVQAIAAIPAVRTRKTTNPLNPDTYLRDKLFASHTAKTERVSSAPAKVRVERISPQGDAWDRHWRDGHNGKSAPWSSGSWWFDTEWPPPVMADTR